MKLGTAPMKNFHLPLQEETYCRLRAEAERAQVPATVLAREAIQQWLRLRERRARHDAIAAYAAGMAGTEFDLDPELELAGTDHLTDKNILSHELLGEVEDGLKAALDLE